MKYYVTDTKSYNEKQELLKLGLYCYDLRDSDFGNDIASIEKSVLINRVGSIITDKSLYFGKAPNDYIDYNIFTLENKSVESIEELLVSKIYLTTIKLDSDENINNEFDFLFSECENYKEIEKLDPQEKKKYIIDHYEDVSDYDLLNINDNEYKLYRIDYSKELEVNFASKKSRTLDNGIYIINLGYRNEQPVALVERTAGDYKEYIIAINYEIKDNKMDWGYGYYYDLNIKKAKKDFEKVLAGGSLADTFENKTKEKER